MTKWKTQKPDTLIMMHAHNQWSRLYSYVLQAADDLGIPVSVRDYANHYDGSHDREWLVPAGMKRRIYDLAYARQTAARVIEAMRLEAKRTDNAFVDRLLLDPVVIAAAVSAYLASVDRAVETCEQAGLK